MKWLNKEFFKIGNSKKVTVVIEMQMDNRTEPMTALRNAREGLGFLINSDGRTHKSWVYSVEVK